MMEEMMRLLEKIEGMLKETSKKQKMIERFGKSLGKITATLSSLLDGANDLRSIIDGGESAAPARLPRRESNPPDSRQPTLIDRLAAYITSTHRRRDSIAVEIGVSKSSIDNWLAKRFAPTGDHIKKIETMLREQPVSVDVLLDKGEIESLSAEDIEAAKEAFQRGRDGQACSA